MPKSRQGFSLYVAALWCIFTQQTAIIDEALHAAMLLTNTYPRWLLLSTMNVFKRQQMVPHESIEMVKEK